ncbi:MAG TPA: hypothetical protein VGB24_02940 [Longimicrobium sp.]|uniref:hypothetical protein n=1 Tax=Longimicrobium sp. TaxID=2029185 RepID=UPI002ED8ED33
MSAPAPSPVMRLVVFFYLMGTIGFFAGTLTLLGPVRWATSALRARGAGQGVEDLVVRGMILLLVAGAAFVAWKLTGRFMAIAGRGRWATPAVTTALACGALLMWMNPRLVNRGEQMTDSGERFVFGPYPDRAALARLKRQGFTGVITLLHPAVAPFEPRLLAQEREAAREVGIELIHTPMLPWISENEESVERIRTLARSGQGRYYVHCYLGRDRVNVVRRLLMDGDASVAEAEKESGARRLGDMPAFERGGIYHFPDGVHVAPFPTDEEWLGYVLSGSVKQVLSLLDTANAEDATWVAKERGLGRQYRMPVEFATIRSFPYDPQQALAAARRAKALPRPLMVHGFRTVSPAVEAFVQAYRTGLPPLPPSLFAEPMEGGPVRVLAPNVAVGPRPTGREFGAYLQQRGVRGIVHAGTADAASRADRAIAESIGLTWKAGGATAAEVRAATAQGGPWYVYGPGLGAIQAELDRQMDPGVP